MIRKNGKVIKNLKTIVDEIKRHNPGHATNNRNTELFIGLLSSIISGEGDASQEFLCNQFQKLLESNDTDVRASTARLMGETIGLIGEAQRKTQYTR
ncbi:MAG: hypothetical protein AAF558_09920 [Verrucomicrobiota bacterium]